MVLICFLLQNGVFLIVPHWVALFWDESFVLGNGSAVENANLACITILGFDLLTYALNSSYFDDVSL